MLIISIDPATVSGYVLLEIKNDTPKILKVGKMKLPEKIKDRLNMILTVLKSMSDMIPENKVALVGIEDQHFSGNAKTLKTLTHIRTLFQVLAVQMGFDVEVIPPGKWRSIMGFKSRKRADIKKEAKQMVFNQFNLVLSEDASEAVCIALAIWAMRKEKDNV
jgi:Holliday junction resolvasome RuvABC endonuclease subunit